MQVNDMIHGFKVNRIRPLDEIQGEMYEMVHEKTNARAIWLKRNDENKTFSIAFKTTPVDDTGVFHTPCSTAPASIRSENLSSIF